MARLLTGLPVANKLTEDLINRANNLKQRGISPGLAILRVGDNADDLAYEKAALKRCEIIGIDIQHYILPSEVSQNRLLDAITFINEDSSVHGCLMFRPLPKHLDENAACALLAPQKDIDGITPDSMAKIYSGNGTGFFPCTAQSCMELLKHYDIDPAGKNVAVIGRSLVIGRPAASLLLAANASVTICHTKSQDIPGIVHGADIVVVATGRPEHFDSDFFRKGQVVLDVGINWSSTKLKLVGDVDFDAVEPIVAAITPVPNGIGAVTTAVLCKHVIEAAEKTEGQNKTI